MGISMGHGASLILLALPSQKIMLVNGDDGNGYGVSLTYKFFMKQKVDVEL